MTPFASTGGGGGGGDSFADIPLGSTLYVDQDYAGVTQRGTHEQPFTDLQDAFDYAAANAAPASFWIIDVTSDIYAGPYTIDTSLNAIEVQCRGLQGAVIRGNITWTVTSNDFLQFTNCVLSGTGGGTFVGSLAAGSASLVLLNSTSSRTLIDLDNGASGSINVFIRNLYSTASSFSNFSGQLATKGQLFAESVHFGNDITCLTAEFNNCGFQPGVDITITGAGIQQYCILTDSSAPATVTFTTVLGSFIYWDATSKYQWDQAASTTDSATQTLMAPTAAPSTISDSTNSAGTANTLARSDHIHAHGDRGGGSLHAVAVAGGAAGFMSGADKTALNAAVPNTRAVNTDGTTLTGGGDLSADRTLSVLASGIGTTQLADLGVTPAKLDDADFAVNAGNAASIWAVIIMTAGGGGADDISFQLPYKWQYVDSFAVVSTAAAAGGTVQLRTAAAGAGSPISANLGTTNTATRARDTSGGANLGAQTVAAATNIFARRNDNTCAGRLYIQLARQT